MTAPGVEPALLAELVDHYRASAAVFETFHKQVRSVVEDAALAKHVHSIKSRIKDPEHLRDKLERKLNKAREDGEPFGITRENLFERINDLVGVRILHLYTQQFQTIHSGLMELLAEHRFDIVEVSARTWDLESKSYFASVGVETKDSDSLYTSVHYIIDPGAKTKRTAEIQVRTLGEEIWGEVDHAINYPHRVESLACREQLKALARVTSSCTRLVDSIFSTYEDERRRSMAS